jgi:hypothetical protein
LNIKSILNKLLNEVKTISGVDDAEITMKFSHVTCEEPDYCIYIKEDWYHIDKTILTQKVNKIIDKYQNEYQLSKEHIYPFCYIE